MVAALCLSGNALAGTARYGVLNLRQTYGMDIRSFKGMSPGGVLTGSTNSNLVRIAIGQRTDFVPTVPGGYQKFDDRGISYYLPDDIIPNPHLHTLAADGTRADTGYSPGGDLLRPKGSNSHGVIVGHQEGGPLPEGGYQTGAFIYDPVTGGSFKSYYVPYGGVRPYSFHAINDAGYIVGSSAAALYLWTPGVPAIRLVTTDSGTATAINEAAQVVGDDGLRAFFWENGTLTRPVSQRVEDPARPGFFNESVSSSFAKDINEGGVVVGSAGLRSLLVTASARTLPCLW